MEKRGEYQGLKASTAGVRAAFFTPLTLSVFSIRREAIQSNFKAGLL
jgi:hypothetical protein